MKKSIAPFLLALLAASVCFAAEPRPAPGSHGFDWLKPDTARCVALDETAIKRFPFCKREENGTFGLDDIAFACRANKRSEFLIYQSKAICQRNLETMKANAP
jgi:hypothetical protein